MIAVNRREVFRYLGYGRAAPDAETAALAEACLASLGEAARPRAVWRVFPLALEGETARFAGMEARSRSLSKNLRGCAEVVLFAATLGPEADRLLARDTRRQMSRAAVLQAAAAAYIEAYCDDCQRQIAAEAAARGLYVRPRFSPGYGDFALAHQREIVRVLDGPRRLGLTLTEGLALAPSKSVTAVLGLSPTNEKCHIAGCEACGKADCAFRRN